MFHCAACKKVTEPREKLGGRKVEATRPKTYPRRPYAFRYRDPSDNRIKWKDDPGGEGLEIVRTSLICKECASDEVHRIV
jgi:hypothetical protein